MSISGGSHAALIGIALAAACCRVPPRPRRSRPTPLSSGPAPRASCAPGAAGAALRWTAPAEGLFTARLDAGPAPDWDLALFRHGEPAWRLHVVRLGRAGAHRVDAGEQVVPRLAAAPGTPGAPRSSSTSFEPAGLDRPPSASRSSPWRSRGPERRRAPRAARPRRHPRRLAPTAATVVALLGRRAGAARRAPASHATTLIADLRGRRAAPRAPRPGPRPPRALAPCPAAATTYRLYDDYTTEMKDARRGQPDLVRPGDDRHHASRAARSRGSRSPPT